MSYNVAICTPPVPADDDSVWGAVDGLIESKGDVPSVFRELHDQLTARYPCICTLPDDKVDDGQLTMVFGATDVCGITLVTERQCSA